MEEVFTHKFKFKVGDGGQFVNGNIEFNVDGKISFEVEELSIPLHKEVLEHFTELTNLLQKIFKSHGGIKLIRFKEVNEE